MRDDGKVVLKQHRGSGKRDTDHTVQFEPSFNTFVGDVKLSNGRFYFEVQVLSLESVVQFGVCTDGFEARVDPGGEGVGDDSFSFAVDGVRQRKWPGEAFGSEWAVGQVIGFAVDMSQAGCASMSVSVDGSFDAPNGLAFHSLSAAWLSPAFSGSGGRFGINFGDKPFTHSPHQKLAKDSVCVLLQINMYIYVAACRVQLHGDRGRTSGSSRLSMEACSTMTMGLLAVGLAGTCTDTTVKTEKGAKRNSISPFTLLFSTRFTCLQRNLRGRLRRLQQTRRTQRARPPQ